MNHDDAEGGTAMGPSPPDRIRISGRAAARPYGRRGFR